MNSADRSKLADVLGQAQTRGWVGGLNIDQHIEHSLGFASAVAATPTVAVDLGSGGGLPALVLAAVWPQSSWTLVETSLSRAAFLELHCARLGWSKRVVVNQAPVQSLVEQEQYRGRADLVTARSLGPPALVIEAAAPLLRSGGELVVSAAPDATPWPSELLSAHGFTPDDLTSAPPRFHRAKMV
ncbi:MAG: class I SAM-dependent methyltransferase [bacterium]|nr:class I SAM-dependent methyltransferase [bacterium]